jgi:hypothetical protein
MNSLVCTYMFTICTNPGRQVTRATKFCTEAHNICGPSQWKLLHVTHLVPRILRRFLDFCGPGSSVGIATGYGLDGPGIESRWGARIFTHVQTGPEAHPASCTMSTGSFPGVKRKGFGANHPPSSSAEVKKE